VRSLRQKETSSLVLLGDVASGNRFSRVLQAIKFPIEEDWGEPDLSDLKVLDALGLLLQGD